jgi:tRNA threonylcarbamoyladenosine biosynthesis protein TsaB
LPAIRKILERQSLDLNDIDHFAVAIGPGSFTGLRVGLTVAKTFAFLRKKTVIPVSTLDALVFPLSPCQERVIALIDARKNEVYGAIYDLRIGVKRISDQLVMHVDKFLTGNEKAVLVGDGALLYHDHIQNTFQNMVFAPESLSNPSAASIGRLSLTGQYDSFIGDDLFKLVPVYIRRSEAEVVWEKKYGSDLGGKI